MTNNEAIVMPTDAVILHGLYSMQLCHLANESAFSVPSLYSSLDIKYAISEVYMMMWFSEINSTMKWKPLYSRYPISNFDTDNACSAELPSVICGHSNGAGNSGR